MIVLRLDGEGSPAYGVAEVKVLGHSEQSCKSGHPIWRFVAAWTHREHIAYSTSPSGFGETRSDPRESREPGLCPSTLRVKSSIRGVGALSLPFGRCSLESRNKSQGWAGEHSRPRLRNSLGGVVGGGLGGDEALPWFVPRIAHRRMGVR